MISIDINTIVGAAGALLGSCALIGMLLMSRAIAHWRARCLAVESSLAGMRRELEMLASISVRTGRQVKRIEHDYSDVAERVDLVELRGPAKSLEDAIDSARRGADTSKLTQKFGLSRGEAELVTRLHGSRKSA
jgi:Protein of unknown function (DUF2802)